MDGPSHTSPAGGPGGRAAGESEAARYAESNRPSSDERTGLYRLLVGSIQNYAIFILDPEGNVLSWNAGSERLKGYKAHGIIGRHFSTFYPPEDIAAGKPPMELEVAIRTGKYEEEGWRVRKDGSMFWPMCLLPPSGERTSAFSGSPR